MSGTMIENPVRVFKLGSTRLPDPDETMPPEEAVKLYAATYPVINHSQLSEPEVVGDELVYTIEKPAAKTKG